jgi:hypothetical protein
LYEAFREDHLKKMLRYHAAQTKVKPLVRGQQFNYYSYGKMWVFGTRAAAGGAPGDALRMYEGISADTLDALNSMFNYAEVFNSSISLVLVVECLEGLLQVMNRYPAPRSVLILDNCRIHHVDEVQEMCDAKLVTYYLRWWMTYR